MYISILHSPPPAFHIYTFPGLNVSEEPESYQHSTIKSAPLGAQIFGLGNGDRIRYYMGQRAGRGGVYIVAIDGSRENYPCARHPRLAVRGILNKVHSLTLYRPFLRHCPGLAGPRLKLRGAAPQQLLPRRRRHRSIARWLGTSLERVRAPRSSGRERRT